MTLFNKITKEGWYKIETTTQVLAAIDAYIDANGNQVVKDKIYQELEHYFLEYFVPILIRNKASLAFSENKPREITLQERRQQVEQKIVATKDAALIVLLKKYMPSKTFSDVTTRQQAETTVFIQSLLKRNGLSEQQGERKIRQAQRLFRKQLRQKEETYRLAYLQRDMRDVVRRIPQFARGRLLLDATSPEQRQKQAQLVRKANKPYIPMCQRELAARIVAQVQEIKFSTIRHVTSYTGLKPVLELFYGRRNLDYLHLPYWPAALDQGDVDNGDGKVICFGFDLIDTKAPHSVEMVLDLEKVKASHPAAFYKVTDFQFFTDSSFRRMLPIIGEFSFIRDRSLRRDKIGFAITPQYKGEYLPLITYIPKYTLIAYDLENMGQIMTLNFFRCMDQLCTKDGKKAEDYISYFYSQLQGMSDEALREFLQKMSKEFTKTGEFNFYGAYQLDFDSLITLGKKPPYSGTLELKALISSLNAGDQAMLNDAMTWVPELFQNYRFLDYLISIVSNSISKTTLEVLRKKCIVPDWIDNDYYNSLKINLVSDASVSSESAEVSSIGVIEEVKNDLSVGVDPNAFIPNQRLFNQSGHSNQRTHVISEHQSIDTATLLFTTITNKIAEKNWKFGGLCSYSSHKADDNTTHIPKGTRMILNIIGKKGAYKSQLLTNDEKIAKIEAIATDRQSWRGASIASFGLFTRTNQVKTFYSDIADLIVAYKTGLHCKKN